MIFFSDIFIWGFQGKIFYGYRYRLVRFEPNLQGGDLHIKDGEARRLVGSTRSYGEDVAPKKALHAEQRLAFALISV